MKVFVKMERPHRKDCDAVRTVEEGRWDSPWWFPGKVEWRDKIGRRIKSGSRRFLVFECNSTDCQARVLVSEDDLSVIVDSEILERA